MTLFMDRGSAAAQIGRIATKRVRWPAARDVAVGDWERHVGCGFAESATISPDGPTVALLNANGDFLLDRKASLVQPHAQAPRIDQRRLADRAADRRSSMTRITRTIVVALAALAITAPVATAMPIDAHARQDLRGSAEPAPAALNSRTKTPAAQRDMYASTVVKPAPQKQDLRSEVAADPSRAPEPPVGLPTWPLDPRPITPVEQQPVADGDGGGADWQVPAFAIIGSLLLIGGLGLAGTRYRAARTG
jgi:hypothetical protein